MCCVGRSPSLWMDSFAVRPSSKPSGTGSGQRYSIRIREPFMSSAFAGLLKHEGIKISMDGRGRALDNVFVERLWRTGKHKEVYLKDYASVREARQGLGKYFTFIGVGGEFP